MIFVDVRIHFLPDDQTDCRGWLFDRRPSIQSFDELKSTNNRLTRCSTVHLCSDDKQRLLFALREEIIIIIIEFQSTGQMASPFSVRRVESPLYFLMTDRSPNVEASVQYLQNSQHFSNKFIGTFYARSCS